MQRDFDDRFRKLEDEKKLLRDQNSRLMIDLKELPKTFGTVQEMNGKMQKFIAEFSGIGAWQDSVNTWSESIKADLEKLQKALESGKEKTDSDTDRAKLCETITSGIQEKLDAFCRENGTAEKTVKDLSEEFTRLVNSQSKALEGSVFTIINNKANEMIKNVLEKLAGTKRDAAASAADDKSKEMQERIDSLEERAKALREK